MCGHAVRSTKSRGKAEEIGGMGRRYYRGTVLFVRTGTNKHRCDDCWLYALFFQWVVGLGMEGHAHACVFGIETYVSLSVRVFLCLAV